jgi:hypothetical protein
MRSLVKRWWFWLGAVGLAVIVLAGVVAVFTAGDSAGAAFRKVKVGMTIGELHRLIGDGDEDLEFRGGSLQFLYKEKELRFWRSPHERLDVTFDVDGSEPNKVASVSIVQGGPDKRTLWQRIQDEYRYQKYRLGW